MAILASLISITASLFRLRGSNGPLAAWLRAAVMAATSLESTSPSPSTSPGRGRASGGSCPALIRGLIGELGVGMHDVEHRACKTRQRGAQQDVVQTSEFPSKTYV